MWLNNLTRGHQHTVGVEGRAALEASPLIARDAKTRIAR